MDDALLEAYLQIRNLYGCSVDTLVCTPEYRLAFLTRARQAVPDLPEHVLLARLMSLRKRSRLPRTT
jgi:hypothetical protein